MAIIQAKVLANSTGDIKLSASRQGGCSSCAQSQHCAILWHPDTADKDFTLDEPSSHLPDNQQLVQSEKAFLKEGDSVNLHCDEKHLLSYIALLFLPSLCLLLSSTLVLSLTYKGEIPSVIILLNVVMSVWGGSLISKGLLNKNMVKLKQSLVLQPKTKV